MGRATRADAIQIGSVDVTHFSLRHHFLLSPFQLRLLGRWKSLRASLQTGTFFLQMNFLDSPISKPAPYLAAPIEHRFEPYEDNGGYVFWLHLTSPQLILQKYSISLIQHFHCLAVYSTSVAIAGEDFCVVASDTRQSNGYIINSRFSPKAYKMSSTAVLSCNGFHADGLTLKKVLEQKMKVWARTRNTCWKHSPD